MTEFILYAGAWGALLIAATLFLLVRVFGV